MWMRKVLFGTLAAWMLSLLVTAESAADTRGTAIIIKGVHCAGCAKKVRVKLMAVKGVADVQVDVESGVATVKSAKKQPSPRALWEAVEQSGKQPTKLSGPSGTFTSKPKS